MEGARRYPQSLRNRTPALPLSQKRRRATRHPRVHHNPAARPRAAINPRLALLAEALHMTLHRAHRHAERFGQCNRLHAALLDQKADPPVPVMQVVGGMKIDRFEVGEVVDPTVRLLHRKGLAKRDCIGMFEGQGGY